MVRVKIRGIYTTALTGLFLESGLTIVDPSPVIRERFGIEPSGEEEEVAISDRGDKQGVIAEGMKEGVDLVVKILKDAFPGAVFRSSSPEPLQGRLSWAEFVKLGRASFEIEFAYDSKLALDVMRGRSTPTVPCHHLLKSIDPVKVDEAERELARLPAEEITNNLKRELIYTHFRPGRNIPIDHVKLDGTSFQIKGKLVECEPEGKLKIERRFKGGGIYDGLGIPNEEGDWGTVEAEEGSWICKRSYLSLDGRLKGEIYNINTPVEFYQGRLRYIDLEVDVVRWPDGRVMVTDQPLLEEKAEKGFISWELVHKALSIAREVEKGLI